MYVQIGIVEIGVWFLYTSKYPGIRIVHIRIKRDPPVYDRLDLGVGCWGKLRFCLMDSRRAALCLLPRRCRARGVLAVKAGKHSARWLSRGTRSQTVLHIPRHKVKQRISALHRASDSYRIHPQGTRTFFTQKIIFKSRAERKNDSCTIITHV